MEHKNASAEHVRSLAVDGLSALSKISNYYEDYILNAAK
jgi:hypothetical protein